MHIIERGPIAVGTTTDVHSHGHVYSAKVVELKGKRARCVWRNKSGNDFDKWITIPSLSEAKNNPLAAKTRKLRVQATTRERHANTWMTAEIARLEGQADEYRAALAAIDAGATDITGTIKYDGRINYLRGLSNPAWQPKGFVALSLRDAVAKCLDEVESAVTNIAQQKVDALREAEALRAEAERHERTGN